MTYPFVVGPVAGDEAELPAMFAVRQHFDALQAVDVLAALEEAWPRAPAPLSALAPGASIAVAVGSRGISDIATLVRGIVERLKKAGCEPFIVPAMGSHGGATAAGQTELLAQLGVTEAAVGAPVRATMEVVSLGQVDGIPLFLDRFAWEADGIVLVNRVKPHTDFVGPIESGLMKQLTIGLGKQAGAEHYHRLGVVRGMAEIVPAAARAVMGRASIVFGVALVENEDHRAAVVRVVLPEELEETESELLELARQHLPGLPLDDIDLLILDEIGKDISGRGLDPNVTGREIISWSARRERPRVLRIFVRGLTAASHGNALGVGNADAVALRLVDALDGAKTAVNGLTSCSPDDVRIPLVFACDRDAVFAMLATIRPTTPDDVRVVYVRNTLDVARLWVSAGCLAHLPPPPAVAVDPAHRRLPFDDAGNLVSPFTGA
ncbi:MAG TPA: DUF362 domain-containing protein [Thermoleophilia bacterium]